MVLILNILAQPLYVCFFILQKIQTTFPIVLQGLMGQRPVELALAGQLAGWVVLALLIVGVIFVALGFVLDSAFSGIHSVGEFFAVLSNVLGRLLAIALLYALLSSLTYAFLSYSHLVLGQMDYVRPVPKF